MEFMLGCNWWASNAGTQMWTDWNEEAVREDFKILSDHGVNCLRIFPNWRDFQPVWPLYDIVGRIREYRLNEHELSKNPYYLDEKMLERFEKVCDIAEKYNFKLICGILTGWMSGRLFIPPAVYGKNLFTDPAALLFEQKFIEGFVGRMKSKKAIYAWDLGNECNCMSEADNHETAEAWTMMMSNAIRANDSKRPVISGMHSLSTEGKWRISAQAEHTDMLTTHPYPYFVEHCAKDKIGSMRTLLHATCETKYYSELGKKPCLVEELGTLGPAICDNKTAADFLRVNLFSNWAHGAPGVLWWCANEQIMLDTPPYCWNMCETELGMIDKNRKPKPVLEEMKAFAKWQSELEFDLPAAQTDAVCIVTEGQDQWGAAYMSYMLAKQAKVNLGFADARYELPESEVYMLPSVNSIHIMPSYRFDALKKRVADGADLYISNDESIISEFAELTGVRINDSQTKNETGEFVLDGAKLFYTRERKLTVSAENAEIICTDKENIPLITVSKYGRGRVFYVNFPVEKSLAAVSQAYDTEQYKIYRRFFADKINTHALDSECRYIGITEHYTEGGLYGVLINYSDMAQNIGLKIAGGYETERVIKGNLDKINAFDTVIVKLKKR